MAKLRIKVLVRKAKRTSKGVQRAIREREKRAAKTLAQTKKGVVRSARNAFKAAGKSVRLAVKRIKDADKGYKRRRQEIDRFGRMQCVVGILAAEGGQAKQTRRTTTSITVAQVAAFHEFGGGPAKNHPPQRSFIRGYYDEKRPGIEEAVRRMSVSVAQGERTAQQAMDLLGQRFVAGMQARIADGIPPELADSTIARKGSSVPLIDTGQLRSSITYRIRTKRSTSE